jgi:hypothetical protein
VAYEVHDGPTQVAVATHQYLQAFADDCPPTTAEGREKLDRALELAQQTVKEARRVIEGLRPTTLDDFGLTTVLCQRVEEHGAGSRPTTDFEPGPLRSGSLLSSQHRILSSRCVHFADNGLPNHSSPANLLREHFLHGAGGHRQITPQVHQPVHQPATNSCEQRRTT